MLRRCVIFARRGALHQTPSVPVAAHSYERVCDVWQSERLNADLVQFMAFIGICTIYFERNFLEQSWFKTGVIPD